MRQYPAKFRRACESVLKSESFRLKGALATLAQLSRKVEERLGGLDPARRDRARAALADSVRPCVRGSDLAFPAQALLVSGRA